MEYKKITSDLIDKLNNAVFKELVDITKACGDYKYNKHLFHKKAEFVLLFPKTEKYDLEGLDNMEDNELLDLYYLNPTEVLKFSIDGLSDKFNRDKKYLLNYYIKFIE